MTKHLDVRFPTYQEFEAYLKKLAADDPVAPFCQSGRCPIAQWAADNLLLPSNVAIFVDDDSISVFKGSARYLEDAIAVSKEAPRWVEPFIARVDALDNDGDYWWAGLTAKKALQCLRAAVWG